MLALGYYYLARNNGYIYSADHIRLTAPSFNKTVGQSVFLPFVDILFEGANAGQQQALKAHIDAVHKQQDMLHSHGAYLQRQLPNDNPKQTPLPSIEGLLPAHSDNHQGRVDCT